MLTLNEDLLHISFEEAITWKGMRIYDISCGNTVTGETEAIISHKEDKSFSKSRKNMKHTKISVEEYESLYDKLESINFYKLFEENAHGTGYDGSTLVCKFVSSTETYLEISIWEPWSEKTSPETNKLFDVYERIKELCGTVD